MASKKFTKEEALWMFVATYIIAIYMIIQSPLNGQTWLISLLLMAFGTVFSPDAKNMYKIALSFIFKNHNFKIEDAVIIKSNVINHPRDVKITQVFQTTKPSASLDEFKVKILNFLKKEFEEKPHNFIGSEALTKETGLTIDKLSSHIKYLEGKNFIKVTWFLGGNFICQITSGGIDILNSV
jgi:hypothetical protein